MTWKPCSTKSAIKFEGFVRGIRYQIHKYKYDDYWIVFEEDQGPVGVDFYTVGRDVSYPTFEDAELAIKTGLYDKQKIALGFIEWLFAWKEISV